MGNTLNKYNAHKNSNKLIKYSDIHEGMKLIEGSETDYITPSAKVYKYYYDDLYFLKTPYVNKHNKYIYISITYADGKNRSRRLHVLLGKAYVPNPDPEHLKIVGHKDDDKGHCEISNLYWTDNRENTQSAVNHGLNDQPKAEQHNKSMFIKVIDPTSNNIVGVYGSMSECARCIKNIDKAFIQKVYKKENYKPRSKKYIYQVATEQEFNDNYHLRNVRLIENQKVDKTPKVFYLINKSLKFKQEFDNQTQASKICNIPQAVISRMIKTGETIDGWECQYIDSIPYKESSSYENFISTVNRIIIQHIKTNEIKTFETAIQLKKELGLNGHDMSAYLKNEHVLMNEWKVISIEAKQETN